MIKNKKGLTKKEMIYILLFLVFAVLALTFLLNQGVGNFNSTIGIPQ